MVKFDRVGVSNRSVTGRRSSNGLDHGANSEITLGAELLGDEIDIGAHLGRQISAMRKYGEDLVGEAGRMGAVFGQHDLDQPHLDLASGDPDRQQRDADSGRHRRADRAGVVGHEVSRDRYIVCSFLVRQLPHHLAGAQTVNQAIVPRQILRTFGPPVAIEIFGAGAQYPIDGGELAADLLARTREADTGDDVVLAALFKEAERTLEPRAELVPSTDVH